MQLAAAAVASTLVGEKTAPPRVARQRVRHGGKGGSYPERMGYKHG